VSLPTPEDVLAMLRELDAGEGVALTRLAKRLDTRVSVLLRQCADLGPERVRVAADERGHWRAWLSPESHRPR
jgi:hypothetical protein